MEQNSHIISENVFGTSRKIQFIGLRNTPRHPMESLLNAIESAESAHSNSNHSSNNSSHRSSSTQQRRSMSIKSLLAGEPTTTRDVYLHPRQSATAIAHEVTVESLLTSDPTTTTHYNKRRREEDEQRMLRLSKNIKKSAPVTTNNAIRNKDDKTIITCYHASVAQKSYGSEKRFLCPPPKVQIKSPSHSKITKEERCDRIQLLMSVIKENGDKVIQQGSLLDENQSCSFKYLHVTGTAKAKQFKLAIDLLPTQNAKEETDPQKPLATFVSKPISIISKPSKKAAKTRNVSTCILTTSPVSLFNRINSQTVRTKYMTASNNRLCAKNTTWSPFDIIVVSRPVATAAAPSSTTAHQSIRSTQQPPASSRSATASRLQLPPHQQPSNNNTNANKAPVHISYGTEIILREIHTGVMSPPLIIRKVDKGRIAPCAYGPVSQMQKVALQLASSVNSQPIYLSASGSHAILPQQQQQQHLHSQQYEQDNRTKNQASCNNAWLDFSPSRLVQPEQMKLELSYEEVDDYVCWTIVGINKFEYQFIEEDGNMLHATTTTTMTASVGNTTTTTTTTTITPPSPPPLRVHQESSMTTSVDRESDLSSSISPLSSPIPTTSIAPTTTVSTSKSMTHSLPLLVTDLQYQDNHTLHLTLHHATPQLDIWLGSHGPLKTRIQQHQPSYRTDLSVELPLTQDLLVANHDLLVTREDGHRILELPLLLVRSQDGTIYPTGKALLCDVVDNAFRWSVVASSSSSSPSTSSSAASSSSSSSSITSPPSY
ncbi:hypothetical protein BDF20DRAFT_872497 [Mycotypha africana]|uniref:uncharacterized protein n=1 Tax=Mycotypha africana TaxID=64632 RepID=UPI0023008146|nr:uncharacterized protein BDF20DRAFT_872497 [Mycotypha africana]KAI8977028.1 hypothetical protein BDF20DRAFT_872497 [Mycotypha africana]